MKKHLSMFLVLVLAFILLVPTQTAQAAIKLNKTKITISQGEYYTLKLSGTKSKITWTTNNKKIATVTSSGKVYGAKTGTAFITATVGNKQYTCKVLVAYPTLKNHTVKLRYGETYQVQINNLPKQYSYSDLKFNPDFPSFVEINDGGKITAKIPGTIRVTITFGSFKLYQTVIIQDYNSTETEYYINDNASFEYTEYNNNKQYIAYGKGDTFGLDYSIEYYNENNLVSVSNQQFAEISNNAIAILHIPNTDKEYTSTKLRFVRVSTGYKSYEKPDISINAVNPYAYDYTYYINSTPYYDTLNTIDLNVTNNTKSRQNLNASIVFYKAGKVVNVKYYKANLDIGTTIVKESAISDNRLSGEAYNPEYDNYEIFY